MAELLVLQGEMGYQHAWLNWKATFDLDGKGHRIMRVKDRIDDVTIKIGNVSRELQTCLQQDEWDLLMIECQAHKLDRLEHAEQEIERRFRPPNLIVNKKAIVILTKHEIPEDIIIGLSFDHKFLFPYICDDKNVMELLAQ